MRIKRADSSTGHTCMRSPLTEGQSREREMNLQRAYTRRGRQDVPWPTPLHLSLLPPLTEDPSPDSHNVTPRTQRGLEIARHAHAEQKPPAFAPRAARFLRHPHFGAEDRLQRVARRAQRREVTVLRVRLTRLCEGANGHEPAETEARACRDDVFGEGDELRALVLLRLRRGREGREPGLCVLTRGVHLQKDVERRRALGWKRAVERGRGFRGCHRLDGVDVENSCQNQRAASRKRRVGIILNDWRGRGADMRGSWPC